MIDVSSENIYASKLFDQLDLEGGPVHDVVERSWFSKRDGILSESHFDNIFSSSQVVQDGCQPGVEVCRFAAPVRCIKFRRFETGVRLFAVLRRGGGRQGWWGMRSSGW